MSKWDHLVESDATVRAAFRKLMVSPDDADAWAKAHREARRMGGHLGWVSGRHLAVLNRMGGHGLHAIVTNVTYHTKEEYPDLD